MCTLTIRRGAGSLLVTMNRDERRARGPEVPPRIEETGDVRWVAPIDSVRGGTWMGANEHGVVACLLNLYFPGEGRADTGRDRPSRGAIIPSVLAQGEQSAGVRWVESHFDPADYPSFQLVLASAQEGRVFQWAPGGEFQSSVLEGDWWLATSSSWRTAEVLAWRAGAFEQWLQCGAAFQGYLPAFHLLQPAQWREWSPLMARETTCSRSITQVECCGDETVLRYWSLNGTVPDCERPEGTVSLGTAIRERG